MRVYIIESALIYEGFVRCGCYVLEGVIVESEYQLFVCDVSGQHEPVTSFVSNTPFPNLSIGQRFDDHGWQRLRGVGQVASEDKPIRYLVHSIKNTIFVENGINIIQSWVNLEPYHGDRSPAFGNTDPTMNSKEALS